MIRHQVEALASAGVTDIVLAVNYRPEIMTAALEQVRHQNASAAKTIRFGLADTIRIHSTRRNST